MITEQEIELELQARKEAILGTFPKCPGVAEISVMPLVRRQTLVALQLSIVTDPITVFEVQFAIALLAGYNIGRKHVTTELTKVEV